MVVMQEVLNSQVENTNALLDVPNPSRLVTRSADEESTISREVQRVNLLHVALQEMSDTLSFDVPDLAISVNSPSHTRKTNPNLSVLSSGSEEFAVGAEANTSDIQISGPVGGLIEQNAVDQVLLLLGEKARDTHQTFLPSFTS
jgi:hypothetical protein